MKFKVSSAKLNKELSRNLNAHYFLSVNVLLCIVLLLLSSNILAEQQQKNVSNSSLNKSIELGKRLYRQGILSSGNMLTGYVQGDIRINGSQLACINCHKRSGLGASEGNVVTPVITANVLFKPKISRASKLFKLRNADKKTRDAYTEASLMRAIVKGENPNGRSLNLLMPRYELSEEDQYNLLSYLKSVSSIDSPGVSKTEMQIATIFIDTVSTEEKRTTLRVLHRFIRDWNTDTRPHTRRAQNAPWHKKWHYEAHRKWVLNIWTLDGPPETWHQQLKLQYGRQPVFAVLGGVSNGENWSPIGKFCESMELPCLFPNTNLPQLNSDNFYSIYYSRGVTLEAEVLAKYLVQTPFYNGRVRITQVYGDSEVSLVAAKIFRKKLSSYGYENLQDVSIARHIDTPDIAENNSNLAGGSDIVVYWLNDKQYKMYRSSIRNTNSNQQHYVSESLLRTVDGFSNSDSKNKLITKDYADNTYIVYPYMEPKIIDNKMRRTKMWLEKRNIPLVNARLQANTLFSATLLSRTIKHLGSNFSRDYLIEKLEHLDQNIALSPLYPRLSLGPGQRYGSKGAYIAKLQADKNEPIKLISEWIIP